jgi:hypothetical protein
MSAEQDGPPAKPTGSNRRMTPGWREGPRPASAQPPARPMPDNDMRDRKPKTPR